MYRLERRGDTAVVLQTDQVACPSTKTLRNPSIRTVIVMGASAGGVDALLQLAAGLPADLAAPLLVVHHIGAYHSRLHELLAVRGPNRAVTPQDGEPPVNGTIYVAPADNHMILEGGVIRLTRGPKENHARPAIDPLFRSAALDRGAHAIGVILTGMLDDGTAGLRAIKDHGGIAVVQDPRDAYASSMPSSAIANVAVDHIVSLTDMPELLARLARQPQASTPVMRVEAVRREHAASLGKEMLENLSAIASPSMFTCPECSGALFELHDKRPVRYRCHTGHAYTLRALAQTHSDATEEALWSAIRALQEKHAMLLRMAVTQKENESADADKCGDQVAAIEASILKLRMLIEGLAYKSSMNESGTARDRQ